MPPGIPEALLLAGIRESNFLDQESFDPVE